ncbi:MAG: hypothetical protein V4615_05005 [Bacteroidota bacterium]
MTPTLSEIEELQQLRKYHKSRNTMIIIGTLLGIALGAVGMWAWILLEFGFNAFG